MQTNAPAPQSAPTVPISGTARHAAARPHRRRLRAAVLAVLALAVGLAATTTALLLPGSAPDPVGAALAELRRWPSITVDGYLTVAEPVGLRATVTADGAARGTASRPRDARAEFAVGPGGTLLRGNLQWWVAPDPAHAELLADRWIRDPQDAAIDQVARGRLTPAALADALAGLRDPGGRTEADVVVDGTPGRSFVAGGTRLVVGRDGLPLAVAVHIGGPGATAVAFRSEPQARRAAPAALTLRIAQPDPAADRAARTAISDVLARGSVPSLDEIALQESAPPVAVEVLPDPRGCPPAGCTVRVRLTNSGPAALTGLYTVRIDDEHLVEVKTLSLPPRSRTELPTWIPGRLLTAHPDRRLKIEAAFTPYSTVTPRSPDGDPAVGGAV